MAVILLQTSEIRKSDFDEICFCCLSRDCLASVFMINFEGAALSSILEDTLNVQVSVEDPLSKKICGNCIQVVIQFYVFKRRFNESQATLQRILTKKKDRVVSFNEQFSSDGEIVVKGCDVENDHFELMMKDEQFSSDGEIVVENEHFELSSDSEDDTLRDTYGIPKDLNIVFVDIETAKKELNDKGFVLNHLEQDGEVERIVCMCDGTSQCLYHRKIEVEPLNIKDEEQEVPIPTPTQFKCATCGKILSLKGKQKHLRTHMTKTKDKRHICQICSRAFNERMNFERHLKIHTGEKPYVCEFCGHRFIQKVCLKSHLLRHTGEKPLMCEYCGKCFTTQASLTTHLLVHKKGYVCGFCSKVFRDEKSLNLHKQSRHSEGNPFVCTHCNEKCNTKLALTNHLKTHGIQCENGENRQSDVFCQICDKEFSSKHKLKIHLLYHGDKKFFCTICYKKFYTSGQLTVHKRVHTGEKPYHCKCCGRTFSTVGGLQLHMHLHTGKKPYECKLCDKAFVQSHHLKHHMMVHTGEKPYSCPHCDKKSRSKFNMECHIRLHTGEKPFKCDICSKAFRNPIYLGRHKKKAH